MLSMYGILLFAMFLVGIVGDITYFPTATEHTLAMDVSTGSPKLANLPYFDLTDLLNSENHTGIEHPFSIATNIYYSTDFLVSELPKLAWIAQLMDSYGMKFGSTPKRCLMISFQITDSNHYDIDWRHMADVLDTDNLAYNPNLANNTNLQTLRKYLCKVLLNFQISPNGNKEDYAFSQEYLIKWDISFIKYARDTINTIFGTDETQIPIPVGVLYAQCQVFRHDDYLLEQEVRNADFLIQNVSYTSDSSMWLTYANFDDHLHEIASQNKDIIANLSLPHATFMVILRKYKPRCKKSSITCSPSDWATDLIFNASQPKYQALFQKFVGLSSQINGAGSIDIISGTIFKTESAHKRWGELHGRRFGNILAPLYVQRLETTPCQLRSMLDQISRSFDTLVLNEFSLDALSRNFFKIVNTDIPGSCASVNCPIELPKETILIASEGIGHHWNKTEKAFKKLMSVSISSLGQINLSTLVFSSADLEASSNKLSSASVDLNQYGDGTGIIKFAREWVQANKTKVGCLVDLSSSNILYYDPAIIADNAQRKCSHIFQNSSLFIWKYQLGYMEQFYMRDKRDSLVRLLAARALFLKEHPDKQVIFDFEPPNELPTLYNPFRREEDRVKYQLKYRRTFINWSRVHNVKIMLQPAFDFKYPTKRYFNPPLKDGSFVKTNNMANF